MNRRQKIIGGLFIAVSFLVLIGLGFPMLAHQGAQSVTTQKEVLIPINFLQKPYPKIALLYFGVVGCKTICGPTMQEIDGVYKVLKDNKDVAVYFINISDLHEGSDSYAKYFNPAFHGVEINSTELSKFQKELDLYYSKPLTETGDMYHSGHLYLFSQQNENIYKLSQVYITRPFDYRTIQEHINKELK